MREADCDKHKKREHRAPFLLIAASAFAGFAGTNFAGALSVCAVAIFHFCFHDVLVFSDTFI